MVAVHRSCTESSTGCLSSPHLKIDWTFVTRARAGDERPLARSFDSFGRFTVDAESRISTSSVARWYGTE